MENSQVEILLVEDNIDDAEMTINALRKKQSRKQPDPHGRWRRGA
jgi:hypothetical protein